MFKKLLYGGLILGAASAAGQARPALGLRPYPTGESVPCGKLLKDQAIRLLSATNTLSRLPSYRRQFAQAYALTLPIALPELPHRTTYVQPGNQLVYFSSGTGLAVASAVDGALIGALLSTDPRIQTYQNRRLFTGGEAAFTYRHADVEGNTR